MAISYVNGIGNNTGSNVTSFATGALSCTKGNLMVVYGFSGNNPGTSGYTAVDTSGSVWTCSALADAGQGLTYYLAYAICAATTASKLVTVTFGGQTLNSPWCALAQYSSSTGFFALSLDATGVYTTSGSTTISTSNIITANAPDAIVAVAFTNANQLPTGINSGWNIRVSLSGVLCLVDNLTSAAGTFNLTGTTNGGWSVWMNAIFGGTAPVVATSGPSISGTPLVAAESALNTTPTLVAANVQSIVNPVSNRYLVCGVNSVASGSISSPIKGINANPCGRPGDSIPQVMVQLQNLVLSQATYTYRL